MLNKIKKIPKKLVVCIMIFTLVLSYIAPITKVLALSYGEGENFIKIDIVNNKGYSVSAKVNNIDWSNSDDEYHTLDNQYKIVINVSRAGIPNDKTPTVLYGGNWKDYINIKSTKDDNNYTFELDVNNSSKIDFLGLTIDEENQNPNEAPFDGKAYVVWSCGQGVCYHYFDNIPSFNDGNSTYYKNTDVKDDNNNTVFDVKAKYKGWILKNDFDRWVTSYKNKNNITEIDWTKVNPKDIVDEAPTIDIKKWEDEAIKAGKCTKENTPSDDFKQCIDKYIEENSDELPFVKLQPVGEPQDNNAYVSYGDRNFKVVIYNNDFKGVSIGDLSTLNYYPSNWTNPFIRRDHFDISGTTKDKPTGIDTILLESTVTLKTINCNSFEISSIEALDVPEEAVTITKENNEFKLIFSSNFYDKVVFKVTDINGEISYLQIKRYTIDGWIKMDNVPILTADFYFDKEKTYNDFDLTAKILYKDGTTKNVTLTPRKGIDDGLGNITDEYEVNEEDYPDKGKGLKRAKFEYDLQDGEDKLIKDIYLNAEYKGSTESNYAGAYVGSGEGILANLYHGEEE